MKRKITTITICIMFLAGLSLLLNKENPDEKKNYYYYNLHNVFSRFVLVAVSVCFQSVEHIPTEATYQ